MNFQTGGKFTIKIGIKERFCLGDFKKREKGVRKIPLLEELTKERVQRKACFHSAER